MFEAPREAESFLVPWEVWRRYVDTQGHEKLRLHLHIFYGGLDRLGSRVAPLGSRLHLDNLDGTRDPIYQRMMHPVLVGRSGI